MAARWSRQKGGSWDHVMAADAACSTGSLPKPGPDYTFAIGLEPEQLQRIVGGPAPASGATRISARDRLCSADWIPTWGYRHYAVQRPDHHFPPTVGQLGLAADKQQT